MHPYLLLVFLLLAACSNIPTAIKDAPMYDIFYSQANQAMGSYKNASVRWGGVIVDVENEQDYSLLQVLYYPLTSYGKPQLNEAYAGRFAVKSVEFLDPAIYAKNTLITIAGTLAGDIERKIGNKTMRLPLMLATTLYLWPSYDPGSYYQGGFGMGYGIYGPYAYPYYLRGYYQPYPFLPFRHW